ncbi:unnamed protein product [Urochloa humidicola]
MILHPHRPPHLTSTRRERMAAQALQREQPWRWRADFFQLAMAQIGNPSYKVHKQTYSEADALVQQLEQHEAKGQ